MGDDIHLADVLSELAAMQYAAEQSDDGLTFTGDYADLTHGA